MGEWFMDNGMDALIIFDDLFPSTAPWRIARCRARLEAPLRPQKRILVTCSYLHSRLLERSARVSAKVRQRKFVDGTADHRDASR